VNLNRLASSLVELLTRDHENMNSDPRRDKIWQARNGRPWVQDVDTINTYSPSFLSTSTVFPFSFLSALQNWQNTYMYILQKFLNSVIVIL
jgi:hypothetical protein